MKPYPKDKKKERVIKERKASDEKLSQGLDLKISVREIFTEQTTDESSSGKTFSEKCTNKIRTEVEKMIPKKIGIIAAFNKEAPGREFSDLTDTDRNLLIKIAETCGIHYEPPRSLSDWLNKDNKLQALGEYISKVCNFFGVSVNCFFTTCNQLLEAENAPILNQTQVYRAVYEYENPGKSYNAYLNDLRANRQKGGKNHMPKTRGTREQVKVFKIFMGITQTEEPITKEAPNENETPAAPSLNEEPMAANSEPIQAFSSEVLAFYGLKTGKTIQCITGKTLENLNRDDAESIVKFCPIKPLGGIEFKCLRDDLQKLYLFELAQFFMATWVDLAEFWFNNEITAEELKRIHRESGLPSITTTYNPFILRALEKAAQNANSFETRAKLNDLNNLRVALLKVLDNDLPIDDRAKAYGEFNMILDLPRPNKMTVWCIDSYKATKEDEVRTEDEANDDHSTSSQNDSVPNCPEGESEKTDTQEISPVADSDATLLPTGEISLNQDLEPAENGASTESELEANSKTELVELPTSEVPAFGKIDTFYSLRAELPKSAFYEIEAILRKYEDGDAIHILQSSRSHLDVMSLEA